MSVTALSTASSAPAAVLTASDRCDRCGAQAYLHVELASGGELLFCGHHAREYGPELRKRAVVFHDQSGSLFR
jgi:hypothetical protein